jgi:prepilin-type processing-associated H-X9-DG protein
VLAGEIKQTLPLGTTWTSPNGAKQYPISGSPKGVFMCPGFGGGGDEGGTDRAGARGYGMSRYFIPGMGPNGEDPPPYLSPFIKVSKLKKDRILLLDGYQVIMGALAPQYVATNSGPFKNWQGTMVNLPDGNGDIPYREYGVYLRHNKAANYMFSDWHAERSDYYHRTGSATPGNKWTIPEESFIALREIGADD